MSLHAVPTELFEHREAAKETVWKKNKGPFGTKHKLELRFVFSECAPSKKITWTAAIDESKTRMTYNTIMSYPMMFCGLSTKFYGTE